MTAHRYKAEFLVWVDDPDYWVWQYRVPKFGRWESVADLPNKNSTAEYRLVPRPWLEEPEKWEVLFQFKTDPEFWRVCRNQKSPRWDHFRCNYELRPRHKPLYQSRVEIPRAMTEEPEDGATCFAPDTELVNVDEFYWSRYPFQMRLLKAGLLYTTAADAQARLDAMLMTEE